MQLLYSPHYSFSTAYHIQIHRMGLVYYDHLPILELPDPNLLSFLMRAPNMRLVTPKIVIVAGHDY